MPPRSRAATSDRLSAEDLDKLATALAEGRRATVYLNDGIPSLGVDPGASARVLRIDGTTVTASPRGVDDELPFEADEVRLSKTSAAAKSATKAAAPARKPAAPAPRPASGQGVPRSPAPAPAGSAPNAASANVAPANAAPASGTAANGAAAGGQATNGAAAKAAPPRSTSAAQPATRRPAKGRKQPAGPTVSIACTPVGDWTVTVTYGTRKAGPVATVPVDAVERAVAELGDETATRAVREIVDTVRTEARERVEELSRQLEQARRLLEELGTTESDGGSSGSVSAR